MNDVWLSEEDEREFYRLLGEVIYELHLKWLAAHAHSVLTRKPRKTKTALNVMNGVAVPAASSPDTTL